MRNTMLRSDGLSTFRRAGVVAMLIMAGYGACLAAFQHDPQGLANAQNVFRCALAALIVMAYVWAARRSSGNAPRVGQAWLLIAAGMACVLAGAAVELIPAFALLPRGVIFSIADLGQVAFYVLFITAMLLMPREPLDRAGWLSILLDAITISVAGIVLLWSFLFSPAIANNALSQPFSARSYDLLFLLIYPSFGFMLLWTVVLVIFRRPVAVSNLTIALLVAGSALAVLSDALLEARSVLSPFAGIAPAPLAEAVWFAGGLLLGLAAIAHVATLPAKATTQREGRAPGQDWFSLRLSPVNMAGFRRQWGRYLPLAWAVFAYLLLTWGAYYAADITAPVPFIVSVLGVSILFGLVLLRQLATAHENIRLAGQLRSELAERHAAENLVRLNHQRMKHLLSATPAVIYTASATESNGRRLTFVSDNARTVLGHPPSAFTTERNFWLAHVHPDDQAEACARAQRIGDTQKIAHEYRFLTAAGQYVWIHDEALLIRDPDGQPIEVVGYWADVTGRIHMEQALRQANEELESRVQARTAELSRALAELTREIDERKQAEASLRESEAKFRSFVEQSTDCFLLTDEQGNIIEWNRSFEALSGLSRAQAVGRKVWDAQWEMVPQELQTADRRARIEQVLKQTIQTGVQPFAGRLTEGLVQARSGERRIVQQRAFPIRTERGICIGCVLRDVTAQKEVERRLRDSEARYRAISEMISDFAFAVRVTPDNRATLEWVTDGFNRIAGGHLAANGWRMLNWVEDEDRPKARAAIRTALTAAGAAPFELRVRTGAGRRRYIRGNLLAQRGEAGEGMRFICAGQDITARKQAEERERRYTRNIHALSRSAMAFLEAPIGADLYCLIAEQLCEIIAGPAVAAVASFNPASHRLTICAVAGLDRFAARAGVNANFPIKGVEIPIDRASLAQLASGQLTRLDRAALAIALRHLPPATRSGLLSFIGNQPFYSMGFSWNGQLFGSIAILLAGDQHLDNPRLIEAFVRQAAVALQRQHSEAQLQDSLREKEVMLQEIHHRVKNNLQIVSSLLNLQAEQAQDPRIAEMLRDSQNRVRSMAYIHERLYRSPDLAQVNFADYARALTSHLLNSYQSADSGAVSVRVDIGEDARLSVDTAIPCGLIVNELVSNALKHAFPPGWKTPGLITIAMRQTPNGYALSVRDNGVGLPMDVDLRRARSLGLELVAILAQQLGGALEIDRQAGTAFTITFARKT